MFNTLSTKSLSTTGKLITALTLLFMTASCSEQVAEVMDSDILSHRSVMSLKVGSCFDNTTEVLDETAEGVNTLPIRECNEPHDNEVFHVYNFPNADKAPTEAELDAAVKQNCEPVFQAFVGKAYEESEIEMSFFYPSDETWAAGDRELLCYISESNLQKTSQSLKGANR